MRVSTDEQVKHGWNLDEDRQRIRELAEREGWEVVAIFDDGGLQGDDPNRPGLTAMLAAMDDLDVLVMRSLDRLSRKRLIYAEAADKIEAAGVEVHTFKGPVDLDSIGADAEAMVAQEEKRAIKRRVKESVSARRRAGFYIGAAPFGYRWQDKRLAVMPAEAKLVARVFREFVDGASQRSLAVKFHAERVPTVRGGRWTQSRISRMLRKPVYVGKVPGPDGDLIDGQHEAIISAEQWDRVQAILAGGMKRKPGRHVEGGHLLVKGLLRCGVCGDAMLPRKSYRGRPEVYVCRSKCERSCAMPSVRREKVDEPFLASLLDSYIDLDETRRRLEARMESELALAQEGLGQRQAEVAGIERALTATERGFDAGVLSDRQYAKREARLTDELDGAQNALKRAQEHVQAIEAAGPVGDAEQVVLDQLAALKEAAAASADRGPDLQALRNVITQMFESVHLCRAGEVPVGITTYGGDGMVWDMPEGDGYVLWPVLRGAYVDAEWQPVRQALPVERTLEAKTPLLD